jgi:hypothetical protein
MTVLSKFAKKDQESAVDVESSVSSPPSTSQRLDESDGVQVIHSEEMLDMESTNGDSSDSGSHRSRMKRILVNINKKKVPHWTAGIAVLLILCMDLAYLFDGIQKNMERREDYQICPSLGPEEPPVDIIQVENDCNLTSLDLFVKIKICRGKSVRLLSRHTGVITIHRDAWRVLVSLVPWISRELEFAAEGGTIDELIRANVPSSRVLT